jgi:hypothetical protein
MGGKAEEARVLREEARQLREEVTGKKRLEILLQDMREKLHHLGNQNLGLAYLKGSVLDSYTVRIRILGSKCHNNWHRYRMVTFLPAYPVPDPIVKRI